MQEIWKDVKDYEGYYQVSNLGRVRSLDRYIKQKNRYKKQINRFIKGKLLTSSKDCNGYIHIILYKNKKYKIFRVHQLVAQTFIINPKNLPEVNHIDGNKENNCVDNLEWITRTENRLHAYRIGLHIPHKKKCIQKDLDGNIIKIWDSLKQITEEKGYDASAISRCCKKQQKTSYNFIWEYVK